MNRNLCNIRQDLVNYQLRWVLRLAIAGNDGHPSATHNCWITITIKQNDVSLVFVWSEEQIPIIWMLAVIIIIIIIIIIVFHKRCETLNLFSKSIGIWKSIVIQMSVNLSNNTMNNMPQNTVVSQRLFVFGDTLYVTSPPTAPIGQ